jgi:hypothetical protein
MEAAHVPPNVAHTLFFTDLDLTSTMLRTLCYIEVMEAAHLPPNVAHTLFFTDLA